MTKTASVSDYQGTACEWAKMCDELCKPVSDPNGPSDNGPAHWAAMRSWVCYDRVDLPYLEFTKWGVCRFVFRGQWPRRSSFWFSKMAP